jgi:glycosyltransferase involved in cell wall biosynthesis
VTAWHIVTGEYPPAAGGVSDYSQAVAAGLAAAGDAVHVWCPAAPGRASDPAGVEVHAIAGSWSRGDFDRIDAALDAIAGEKTLLVQWVPHAYGRRSLNFGFCQWVRRRARAGDVVDLMVHEPGLGFGEGSLRHNVAAALHRVMLALLLSRARRVWVAIPAWTERLRPWAFGRADMRFCWLPIPSTIPVAESEAAVLRLRAETLARPDGVIVGHFSTYSPEITKALRAVLPDLLAAVPEMQVHLLGRGSEQVACELRSTPGLDAGRVRAAGEISATSLSCHLQACDLLMQPYPDGASTRRTTLMAALAHGVPVVTTVGRLSESFWSDSDAVAAVPAGDMPAIGRTVLELIRRPELRRRLGSAGRGTYELRFGLPRVIDALRHDTCGAA